MLYSIRPAPVCLVIAFQSHSEVDISYTCITCTLHADTSAAHCSPTSGAARFWFVLMCGWMCIACRSLTPGTYFSLRHCTSWCVRQFGGKFISMFIMFSPHVCNASSLSSLCVHSRWQVRQRQRQRQRCQLWQAFKVVVSVGARHVRSAS